MTGWLLAASAAVVIAWAAYLIATVRTRRAAATELTRTRHELAQRINELFSLQELSYLLSESLQLDHIVAQVARFVSRFLHADGSLVALTAESGSILRIAAAEGSLSGLARREIRESETGLLGVAIGRERMEVMESGSENEPAASIAGVPVGRAAVAPLRAHGVTVGAIAVVNTSGGSFAAEDHRLLSTVATHAAIVLANARFFDLIRESKEQRETTFDALTEGMAVVDEAGLVRRANEAMANLLGKPVQAMAGVPLRETPLGNQPLGSGDSVLVTVQARPGQYGITISPRGLSLSAGSLPTVVFSFGRYGNFTVAGSSTRYASAQEYATALDVWREVTADGWSMATGSRTAGTDAVEAQIEAPGDYAVAAPR